MNIKINYSNLLQNKNNNSNKIKESETPNDVKGLGRRTAASTANGKIDTAFGQGNIQDCALLSTVYALSLTKKGSDAIRDSIHINKDNNGKITGYDVTFKGTGEKYHVSQAQLDKAKTNEKDARKYSYGDDDMTILELAIEDCFKNSKDSTLRKLVDNYTSTNTTDKLYGVNPASVSYLLTGEKSEWYDIRSDEKVTKRFFANQDYTVKTKDGNTITLEGSEYYNLLSANSSTITVEDIKNDTQISLDYNDFINNAFLRDIEDDKKSARQKLENFTENSSLVFAVKSGNNIVKGVNGENIELSDSAHAYAVKDVKDGIVTLVNPWNTGQPMYIKMDSLLNLNGYYAYSLDFKG